MNVHKNARLTPRGRERIVRQVESGQAPKLVAEAAGVCPRTVRKSVDRYRREGLAGLQDRSSRPHRLRRPTPRTVVEEIERLRRQRWTGKQIAAETGVSPATVSRVLRRLGLNKLSALEPAEPVRRYARETPGELIHIDIKKLGRIGSTGDQAKDSSALPPTTHALSAHFDAILFMAAAAIISANVAKCYFERFQVFYACVSRFRVAAKFSEACFEIVHTLPDFRTGAIRIIRRRLVDQIFLKQGRPLGRRILKRCENLASLCEIERSLALYHGGSDLRLITILLH
jgi:transposase